MWREGFDIALLAWLLNAAALLFGALFSARAFIDPKWVQRFVRLQPDEQGGGFAEFRATYGGAFLGLHAVAFVLSMLWIVAGSVQSGMWATGAAAAVAAGWGGSSFGRMLAMLFDGARTGFNAKSAALEALIALAIAGPWLLWFFNVK